MSDDARLARIEGLLKSGLQTEWKQRAYDTEQIDALTGRLAKLSDDDVEQKLVIAGFLATPYVPSEGETDAVQACTTCIYFASHNQFCAAPQLRLPVKAQWSCVLWRM
jgi:hypothetical protein